CERRADAAAREATEVLAEAERRHEQMKMQVEAVLEPRLRVLEETLAQAKAMCRANESGEGASLGGLVERGEKLRAGIVQGLRALEALKGQVEVASREASRTILDAAEQIDTLESRREGLMRSLREALDLCDITGKTLAERMGRKTGGAPDSS